MNSNLHRLSWSLIWRKGGWVLGGLQSEAAWCRHMCNMVNITVIDVDYRMGPEYKYPAAIYDCWDAVKWVSCSLLAFFYKCNLC